MVSNIPILFHNNTPNYSNPDILGECEALFKPEIVVSMKEKSYQDCSETDKELTKIKKD